MAGKTLYVALKVIEGAPGYMATYGPQIAMVNEFKTLEDAACTNIGTHPEAQKLGRPYRSVVIPFEHWNEFEVFSESIKGRQAFRAYPSEHPTLRVAGGDE
jgi:hypothetical protein